MNHYYEFLLLYMGILINHTKIENAYNSEIISTKRYTLISGFTLYNKNCWPET